MFGDNALLKQDTSDGLSLWVQEVFYTLQGEGPRSGEPAVFIRLAGCNLACTWCDTDFESSAWHPTLDELLHAVAALPKTALIVITGGEPFRQNIAPLVTALLETGTTVQIETNGTLWVPLPLDSRLEIICSPKTKNLHPELEPRITAYKYVVGADDADATDGLPILNTQKQGQPLRLARPNGNAPIYVQPRDDQDPTRNAAHLAACRDIALKYQYRISLQLHKIIGIN